MEPQLPVYSVQRRSQFRAMSTPQIGTLASQTRLATLGWFTFEFRKDQQTQKTFQHGESALDFRSILSPDRQTPIDNLSKVASILIQTNHNIDAEIRNSPNGCSPLCFPLSTSQHGSSVLSFFSEHYPRIDLYKQTNLKQCLQVVGNDHFCDTTKGASQRLTP